MNEIVVDGAIQWPDVVSVMSLPTKAIWKKFNSEGCYTVQEAFSLPDHGTSSRMKALTLTEYSYRYVVARDDGQQAYNAATVNARRAFLCVVGSRTGHND